MIHQLPLSRKFAEPPTENFRGVGGAGFRGVGGVDFRDVGGVSR